MEAPQRMKFEDHRNIASEVGEESGEFYSVVAEHIPLKFSAQQTGFTAALKPSASPGRTILQDLALIIIIIANRPISYKNFANCKKMHAKWSFSCNIRPYSCMILY